MTTGTITVETCSFIKKTCLMSTIERNAVLSDRHQANLLSFGSFDVCMLNQSNRLVSAKVSRIRTNLLTRHVTISIAMVEEHGKAM
jgi:hypothetical protein